MAHLKSITTGDFTSPTTWGVNNLNTNATLIANLGSNASTTSITYSTSWTDSGTTNLGVFLFISSVLNNTGTFTVGIYNSGNTAMGSVTVNVADLVNRAGRLIFFRFTTNAILLAGNSYRVGLSSSVGNTVNVARASTTSGDCLRIPITTINSTPSSGDLLYVSGDLIGLGTSSGTTVTMNNTTSATTFGNLVIQDGATLNYGTSASTNYYLRLSGNTTVYTGGTFTIGTQASPIPSTSTAKLEFACASANQYGLTISGGSNVSTYGATKTVSAKLSLSASTGATSATTISSTNWLSGDIVSIAPTRRVSSEVDIMTLSGNASGANIFFTTGLTFNHDTTPTTPTACDVINLTRNVQILGQGTGTTGTNVTYIIVNGGTTSFYYTTFAYIGNSNTVQSTVGFSSNLTVANSSLTVNSCAFYGGTSTSVNNVSHTTTQSTTTFNFTNNVLANSMGVNSNVNVTSANTVIDNTIIIRGGFNSGRLFITLTNLTVAGSVGNNINLTDNSITSTNSGIIGRIDNITSYCSGGNGIVLGSSLFITSGLITNINLWRNMSIGLLFLGSAPQPLIISGATLTANVTANAYFAGGGQVYLNSLTTNSSTVYPTLYSLQFAGTDKVYITDSNLGVTIPETSGAILAGVNGSQYTNNVMFYNTNFGSGYTTIYASQNNSAVRTNTYGVSSMKHNGVLNSNFNWQSYGTITTDSTIYNSSLYSMRMTPSSPLVSALQKMISYPIKIAINANDTITISVVVRKSTAGDGTVYNGNQPRLMLLFTPLLNYSTNTVLASASASAGTWETLTATFTPTVTGVYEFYVDCDGTTGWINVDDWSTNYVTDTTKMDYWFMGMPEVNITGIPKERTSVFLT
jgi:hypothetical protein